VSSASFGAATYALTLPRSYQSSHVGASFHELLLPFGTIGPEDVIAYYVVIAAAIVGAGTYQGRKAVQEVVVRHGKATHSALPEDGVEPSILAPHQFSEIPKRSDAVWVALPEQL